MAHKTNHISILQFDEHVVSWMRVARSSSGVHVLGAAVVRGSWSVSDESLQATLKDFSQQHRISDDVLCTILPRHDMTARILDLPSEDPEEISRMMELSAGEFVPYAAEELILDQCILRKSSGGESRVLAVFAHRDVVESHLRVLGSVGLEPDHVYLSSACLASGAVAARPRSQERFALINLASGGLEALVINGQSLDYGRGIATTQDWGPEGAQNEIIEELGTEVRASLSAYRRESEDGQDPEIVYLCSDWVDVRQLAELLAQHMGNECAPALFARDLVLRGRENLQALPLVAIGAAMAAQERAAVVIDLIPKSVVQHRIRAARKRTVLVAAGLVFSTMAALTGLYYQSIQQHTAVINNLQARISAIEGAAKGVVAKQQRLAILRQQVEQKGTALELVAALCEQAPVTGLNISRISFEHGGELNVWGRAASLAEVDRYAQALRELGKSSIPQFVNARRLYEVEVAERSKPIYSYAIGIPFPQPDTSETVSEE